MKSTTPMGQRELAEELVRRGDLLDIATDLAAAQRMRGNIRESVIYLHPSGDFWIMHQSVVPKLEAVGGIILRDAAQIGQARVDALVNLRRVIARHEPDTAVADAWGRVMFFYDNQRGVVQALIDFQHEVRCWTLAGED